MKYIEQLRQFFLFPGNSLFRTGFVSWFILLSCLGSLGIIILVPFTQIYFSSLGVLLSIVFLSIGMFSLQQKDFLRNVFFWKPAQYGFVLFLFFEILSNIVYLLTYFVWDFGTDIEFIGNILWFTLLPELAGFVSLGFASSVFIPRFVDIIDLGFMPDTFWQSFLFGFIGCLLAAIGYVFALIIMSYILGVCIFMVAGKYLQKTNR